MMHACSVAKSCPDSCDPKDCSPWGFSVCAITQARIQEWVRWSMGREWSMNERTSPHPKPKSSGGEDMFLLVTWAQIKAWGEIWEMFTLQVPWGGQGSLFCLLIYPKLLKWYLLHCRASILLNRWSDWFWHTMWLSLETSQNWPWCAVCVNGEGFNSEGQVAPCLHGPRAMLEMSKAQSCRVAGTMRSMLSSLLTTRGCF